MPYNRYKCDYSNEVHQLLVSLSSKHYIGKDGLLKYQKKPLPHNLKSVKNSNKIRLVNYIIRDHFSGFYYAEMHTHTENVNLGEFLFKAWSKKDNYEFCGIPKYLFVPQIIVDLFPNVIELVREYGIKDIKPENGFQAGSIEAKYWQEAIENFISMSTVDREFYDNIPSETSNFKWLQSKNIEICELANKRRIDKLSRLEKWINNIDEVKIPNDKEDFMKRF